MRLSHKIIILVAAAALCALLAACRSASSSMASTGDNATSEAASSAVSQPASSASSESSDMSGTTSGSSDMSGDNTETAGRFNSLLDNTIGFEDDTAGGSLKNAKAAADLVELLASGSITDLNAEAMAWRGGLDADREARLQANWPAISQTARAIAADPAANVGLLESAGVTTDFTTMDLSGISAQFDILDAAFAAKK